jgi:hypothetical protein
VASCVIKFGAASRVASIANSGGSGTEGKCIHLKDSTKVEVNMLVEGMVSKKTEGPSFHWVGSCTPFVGGGRKNVKATWVGEAEFLQFVVVSRELFRSRIMLFVVGSRVNIRKRSRGGVYVGSIVGASGGREVVGRHGDVGCFFVVVWVMKCEVE